MNAMNMVLLASTNHLIAINRESRIHRERRERRERHACVCRWFKIVSLTRSRAKSLQRRRYRYLLHRIVTTGHHGPQLASLMDAERGGVLIMLPPYAASQAVAPVAKLVQVIPTGTVHVWRSRLKAVADYSAARDGQPCGVRSDRGARGQGMGDGDDMATLEQQHAG